MRTFIALELSGATKAKLYSLITELAAAEGDVKWVDKQNLHLTLKFLGEVNDGELADVCATVSAIAKEHEPISLSVAGLGAFPNLSRPKTLWVGLDRGVEKVERLQKSLEKALAKEGFPKEHRRFHPHVTIGRTRSRKREPRVAGRGGPSAILTTLCQQRQDFRAGDSLVTEATVFSSQLSPEGPIYSAVSRSPLG